MIGIRGLSTTTAFAYLQPVLIYDVVETVVANGMLFAKLFLVHPPQLIAANATVALAYALDELDDKGFLG